MDTPRDPLPRQVILYVLAGLAQLALDSTAYIALTAAGIAVPAANLAGRIAGVALGFWLHGRYTFANGGPARLDRRHLARFLVAWSALTIASTFAVAWVADQAGLAQSWLAKPLVEVALAAVGFFVWRHWVYK